MTKTGNKLSEVFSENRERLEAYAYYLVRDEEVARDIVSSAFLSLYQKKESIEAETTLSYIFTSVRNACLNYRRDKSNRDNIHERIKNQEGKLAELYSYTIESTDPKDLFYKDILSILDGELSKLSEEERRIFIMSNSDGKTYKEIAEVLGIPYKRVRRLAIKANEQVQKALTDYLILALPLLISSRFL